MNRFLATNITSKQKDNSPNSGLVDMGEICGICMAFDRGAIDRVAVDDIGPTIVITPKAAC